MKVSIITPTYNSADTILYNLESVSNQTYKNIEHIIVDNFSLDQTKEIIKKFKNKNLKFFQKKTNIYEAMNHGIRMSKGEIIGIIGSDDIIQNPNSIKKIVEKFNQKNNLDIYTGGVAYFKKNNFKKIVRNYSLKSFKLSDFKNGLMPPHPSTFIKKKIYQKYGLYLTKYKIAGDFEFLLRVLNKNLNFLIEDKIVIRMRVGGVSSKNYQSITKITKEITDILKNKKIEFNRFKIYLRILIKLTQLFFINQNKMNKNFNYSFYEKISNYNINHQFKIIKNLEKIPKFKNFILVAINLAFLGYWIKLKKFNISNILFWPDGIFSKFIKTDIKKIPGRDIIKKITIPNYVKKILVLGNLDNNGKYYLKKKFKDKIIKHTKLPYENIENLYKYLPKIKKDELILITLPTPKQELLAIELAKRNMNYKIICIGGSLNIVSGTEPVTPNILYKYNLEFIWRLRFDTIRRTIRLVETLVYFTIGIFTKSYNKINIK
jgi:exopolysaccharide biosynthesis WecB/TagA/CpsF family protein